MLFSNKPNFLTDLTISIILFTFSFEIINDAIPNPNIYLWIAASFTDATAINLNGIKTLLANGLSTFPIKDNQVFINGSKSLSKNPSSCPILCNSVFDNLVLADKPFA